MSTKPGTVRGKLDRQRFKTPDHPAKKPAAPAICRVAHHGFQSGYVAGAFDMLSSVVNVGDDLSAEFRVKWFREKFDCLHTHASTTRILTAWAGRTWRANLVTYRDDMAAALLLTDACDPL